MGLYLVRRAALSLASALARALVSSSSALPLTASSRPHLASARSRSRPALSFSALTLFPFKFALESGKFLLSLLVELNLSGSVGTSLLKTGRDILNVLLEQSARLLSLGTVASLNVQLLIKLLKSGLKLLDLLGIFGSKRSLILNLGTKGRCLLLLSGNSLVELSLDTLKVRDSLQSQFEVALNLPLGLFNISLDLLLSFQSILSLIKSLFKFSLHPGQVVALVLSRLNVFLSSLARVSN